MLRLFIYKMEYICLFFVLKFWKMRLFFARGKNNALRDELKEK